MLPLLLSVVATALTVPLSLVSWHAMRSLRTAQQRVQHLHVTVTTLQRLLQIAGVETVITETAEGVHIDAKQHGRPIAPVPYRERN
jgi:hypothetical protein